MPTGHVTVEPKRGMQIAYIPNHVDKHGRLDHPDIEYGFVTSVRPNGAFCRYWAKGEEHKRLRTTANSELTPFDNLIVIDVKPTPEIRKLLENM